MRIIATALLCLGFLFLGWSTADDTPASTYHVVKKIPLPGDEGWDYMAMDAAARRLYITRASHAVLTVTTDQGDFILDNPTDKLLRWDKTGYAYVKRQSREDENVWVAIADGGDEAVASTSSLPVVKVNSR